MAEKSLLLQLLDQTWKDHLLSLDHLRQGINLRAYAQRDPLNEYKREAFELFEGMLVASAPAGDLGAVHIELRVPQPVFAEAAAEPEPAMAEEGRATGTSGRPAPVRPVAQRRAGPGNGIDRGEPPRRGPARALGRNPAQRPLPLRFGPKIQALPRPGLTARRGDKGPIDRVGAFRYRAGVLGGCIAQLVEQLTLNQRAAGSSPAAPTT